MWKPILTVLLALDPYYQDNESMEERSARMEVVARAIDRAAQHATCEATEEACTPVWSGSKMELTALLVGLGYFESRFAKHVHEGRCGTYECDAIVYRDVHGRVLRVMHRARSSWQLQRTMLVQRYWDHLEGTSDRSTTLAAWSAALVLASSRGRCKDLPGTISAYAGSRTCSWAGAPKRAKFVVQITSKLREASEDG